MDEYKKVTAGSPTKIHHKTWNACIDLVKAQKNQTASKQNGKRDGFEHDPNIAELATSGTGTIFSMVGITGRITAHSEDLSEFLNQPILQELTSDIKHFGILQRPADGEVIETVTDGLSLCRVKLMQDPESEETGLTMSRCTPSSGNYFYADTIGTHELIWHGTKKEDDPEEDAEKGDKVWGIVRLGDQIQQTVHVQLNYKDGSASPIETEGHYDAKLFHRDSRLEDVRGDVWMELVSGEQNTYSETQDPVFTGYFVGYSTRDNDDGESEERPVISCALCPSEKPFVLRRCDSESNGDPETIYPINKFCPTDLGKTVKIAEYESCYEIAIDESTCPGTPSTESEQETPDDAVDRINECSEPICVTVLEIFDDCEACLCEDGVIPITICTSGTESEEETIYANKLAVTDEEVEVDLTEHKDEIVRLEDGRCGVVGQCTAPPNTDPPEDVVVLEFYAAPGLGAEPCTACLITKLNHCDGVSPPKYTFSDLGEWSDTDFIQDADSDPLACYQKDHTEDPIAWDPEDPPVRFNAAPRKEFADCDECQGDVIYRLTHECTPEQCKPENADDDVDDIVTADTDLAGGDGKYFKVEGLVYSCAIDEEAVEGDITHETVEVDGPYDTCEEALEAPISGRIPPLRKVTISDTDVPKWHINTFIFNASGQITGICPEVVEAEGTDC